MSKTSSYACSVTGTGDGLSQVFSSPTFTNTSSPLKHDLVSLTTGANTLTPPTGATIVCIVPPVTSTNAKTIKGITGDTGFTMGPAVPFWSGLPAAPVAFVVTSAGSEAVDVYWG